MRPVPLASIRFAVDVNVGKLAGLLRMAGFDTRVQADLLAGKPSWQDAEDPGWIVIVTRQ